MSVHTKFISALEINHPHYAYTQGGHVISVIINITPLALRSVLVWTENCNKLHIHLTLTYPGAELFFFLACDKGT